MTGIPVVLEGSRWTAFCPEPQSPAYWPVRRAIERSMALFYAEQVRMLHELHHKRAEDVFVAKYTLMQRQDHSLYSWTSWVDGITDATMPRADFIRFGRVTASGPTNLGFASWERAVHVTGELMEPTNLHPPRFRVREFPTAAKVKQLELRDNP